MARDPQSQKKQRRKKDPEGRMSLGEHLIELRNRLVICAAAVLVFSIVGWFTFPWVFDALKAPFAAAARQGIQADINFQGVGTALNVRLQMAAYTGIILASPVILWQAWMFIMPGLHRNERRYALGFFGTAIPLFFLGCGAGYFAINKAVPVLLSFTPHTDNVAQLIRYDEYLGLLVKTMLAFGIAFVMPVLLVLLNFIGILPGRTMLKAWRWVVFVCFAFTAVMVPTPEPVTLIGMSAAIASLFFAAVGIAIVHDRRRDRRLVEEERRQEAELAARTDER